MVITAAAGIMLYLLMTPCGMDTKIEGENNIVRSTQMIHILSHVDQCDILVTHVTACLSIII